jgi:hypothetical protein
MRTFKIDAPWPTDAASNIAQAALSTIPYPYNKRLRATEGPLLIWVKG